MPTYKNETRNNIDLTFNAPHGIKRIVPGQQVEIEEIYTDAELATLGLTKITDTPYYNPLFNVQEVFSDSDLISEVIIDPLTRLIRIQESDVDITVYFNSMGNLPGYPIDIGSSIDIESRRNIIKLYIVFSSAGSCKVMEFKKKGFLFVSELKN